MATYLITGSSRGIGLALITYMASLPDSMVKTVIGTHRDKSPALKDLEQNHPGRVLIVPMEVTNEDSIKEAARLIEEKLEGQGIDYLVNNAGVMPVSPQGIESMENLTEAFNINVTGVHNVTRTFLPLLRQGQKKVVNISTTVGSIGMAPTYRLSPAYAYKISKAALNMLTVQYALQYADEGFIFVAISPGWLQTDMGGSIADLPVETGVKAVWEILEKLQPSDNGKFLNIHVPGWETVEGSNQYDGAEVAW